MKTSRPLKLKKLKKSVVLFQEIKIHKKENYQSFNTIRLNKNLMKLTVNDSRHNPECYV